MYLSNVAEEEDLLQTAVDTEGKNEELVDVSPLERSGEEHAPGAGAVHMLHHWLLCAVFLSVGCCQTRLLRCPRHGPCIRGVIVQQEDDDNDSEDAARQVESTENVPLQHGQEHMFTVI